ncbi:hypothetical protein EDD85DRAFT_969454 [Armillaria nabsnona]|nr:hypothetical protein EDD85DRAFT_969454 [Armillaria nabsnona]
MKNENVNVLDPREQRKLAVAKLKLAASLPRLEGGRRPQTIQPEAASEVEKVQDNIYQTSDIDTPPSEGIEPQVEMDAQLQEPSTEDTEVNAVPPPSTRSVSSAKHDTNVLTHVLRSPISIHRLSSPPPPPPPPSLPPPPLPPLPPLEDIGRNRLLRQSHSTIRRQAAVHALTDDVYLPLTPAATPPPLREIPHCNPTVTGDEHFFVARALKRKQRLNVLTPRVPKETDAEATNGKDRPAATTNSPRTPPMPLLLTPPPTPSPLTQHHPDILPNIRTGFRATKHFPSTSAIPKRMKSSPLLTLERKSTEKDRPAPARWRGIIVEEEDDEDDEEEVLYPTGTSHLRLRYGHGREVSWIAPPEIRLPDDDDINQDKDNESSIEDCAPSSAPVSYLQQDADVLSPRAPSISRHSVVIDSEIPSDTTSFQTPPSLPPFRLSVVASPAQEDQTPLNTNFVDLDGRIADIDASKHSNGDTTSINTWEKITSFISPRSRSHSRSGGFGSREVRDRTDSSISHECRASLDIGRTDKRDGSTRVARQSKIMHLLSASASVPSLIPSSMSPVPPTSGLDYHQYQSSKLFPFPGLKKLEEERRLKGRIGGSSSTLDVSILGSRVERDQVPMSAKSSNILPGVEHRIGHQTSDTTMRYQHLASFATVSLSSQRDDSNISSTGSSSSKVPFVQRRLNTKTSKFSSSSSRPEDGASNTASLSYHEMIADHEVLPINETGALFGMGYTETIPVLSIDVSEDEEQAIVDALLDASREPGPWHILDATTNELAKKVATILSKSEIYEQLSDLPVIQAQSTLDFLQDLLDIRGLPLSYKRTFLKTSLKLSRVYDCVPRCLTIGGFNRTGTHPFARGHFGDLWKGEVGGTKVAVKQGRIFTRENNVKKVLRKMTREAIIWGQCDHPNVLPFYGIYCDSVPLSYCLVSPFMANGPLRQYLSNVDNPDRHSLALDITRGMNYLHKLFLVHGDLKGDNILITDDHRAVIADFGISFVMGITFFGTSSSSRKGGTVKWQPPEVLNGSPNGLSADVYSLACVYFEVFDGSMPWSDLNDGAVIMNVSVRKKHPPRPKHLAKTDLWWELMVRCWAYEPSDRPTLQYLMESLHVTGDTLPPPPKWDKPDLARLRGPLVQGKLDIPSDLPSFLNVESASYLSDPSPKSVNPN